MENSFSVEVADIAEVDGFIDGAVFVEVANSCSDSGIAGKDKFMEGSNGISGVIFFVVIEYVELGVRDRDEEKEE